MRNAGGSASVGVTTMESAPANSFEVIDISDDDDDAGEKITYVGKGKGPSPATPRSTSVAASSDNADGDVQVAQEHTVETDEGEGVQAASSEEIASPAAKPAASRGSRTPVGQGRRLTRRMAASSGFTTPPSNTNIDEDASDWSAGTAPLSAERDGPPPSYEATVGGRANNSAASSSALDITLDDSNIPQPMVGVTSTSALASDLDDLH